MACNDTPANLANFASKQTGIIGDKLMKSLATRSTWTNILEGGTFKKGLGDSVRFVTQLPSITVGLDYAKPALIDYTALCGERGNVAKHSTVEYSTKLQSLRGRGPDICVNQGFGAFESSFDMALDALIKDTLIIRDSIDRSQVYALSASKYTAVSTIGFAARLAGGDEANVGVAPIATLPDSAISFAGLRNLVAFFKERKFAEPFTMKVSSGGYDQYAVFVGSQEIIDSWRRETAVQQSLIALTTGGFKFGEKSLTAMNFDTAGAWQGIASKADQFPLRYDTMAAGYPVFINPFVEVVDSAPDGRSHRGSNPAYDAAVNEVGFVLFANAIKRLVPEKYTGEGKTKFDARLTNGEVEWHYIKDNSCNSWGDFGFHKYQFVQAYRPLRPQHVVAVHYKRCALNDLTAC